MTTIKELETYAQNTWCPGCGNFGILNSIKKVLLQLQEEGLDPSNVVLVSGIGCHAKIVDYVNSNSFYSIHGRVPPPMTGIKLANPDLTVIGHAGDGDAYGEGIEHLIFSAKRNLDMTFIGFTLLILLTSNCIRDRGVFFKELHYICFSRTGRISPGVNWTGILPPKSFSS